MVSIAVALLAACKSEGFTRQEMSHFQYNEEYDSYDSLYFSDYIIYAIAEEPRLRYKIKVNSDSLLGILQKSMNELNIPIKYKGNGNNYAHWSYFTDRYLDYETVNTSLLFKSAHRFTDRTIVFPVLQMYYRQVTNFDHNVTVYPKYYCYVSLGIFMVKNSRIVYYKQSRHYELVDKEHHPFEFEDFHIPIPHKAWLNLVSTAFSEYITHSQ